MTTPHQTTTFHAMSHEERAFFARLAAMNTMFESARSGVAAQSFSSRAQSCEALLATFLETLKSDAM
jgi:hypothetical protein